MTCCGELVYTKFSLFLQNLVYTRMCSFSIVMASELAKLKKPSSYSIYACMTQYTCIFFTQSYASH